MAGISLCVISRADGPPGKERNHICGPDSSAVGSTSPACCPRRCPGSVRAHGLGKTHRCSPGAAHPGIGAAERMGQQTGWGIPLPPCSRPPQADHKLAAAHTAGGRYNDSRLVIKTTAVSLAQHPPMPAGSCQLLLPQQELPLPTSLPVASQGRQRRQSPGHAGRGERHSPHVPRSGAAGDQGRAGVSCQAPALFLKRSERLPAAMPMCS